MCCVMKVRNINIHILNDSRLKQNAAVAFDDENSCHIIHVSPPEDGKHLQHLRDVNV